MDFGFNTINNIFKNNTFKTELFNVLLNNNSVDQLDINNDDHMILLYFNPNKEFLINFLVGSEFSFKFTKNFSKMESKLNCLKASYNIHNRKKLTNSFLIISLLVYGSQNIISNINVKYDINELNLFKNKPFVPFDDEVELFIVDDPNPRKKQCSAKEFGYEDNYKKNEKDSYEEIEGKTTPEENCTIM